MLVNRGKKDMMSDSRKRSEPKGSGRTLAAAQMAICAFHSGEKITNFCTNRQCLLPLCPKCVKIHTQQHIKMGIFGEFDTIQESVLTADEGLQQSVSRLGEFQKLVMDIRQSLDAKVGNEKKVLREAKNFFLEQIERIFDGYDKALQAYQRTAFKDFYDDLFQSQDLLTRMSEHCQKALRRLTNPQTIMEGVINFYSEVDELDKIEVYSQTLERTFPESVKFTYDPTELSRLESTIKRYIDAGPAHETIWKHYSSIFSEQQDSNTKRQHQTRVTPPKDYNREPIPLSSSTRRQQPKRESPLRDPVVPRSHKTPERSGELSNLESKLMLSKFKSPLDNFSLTKLRRERNDLE